MNRLTFFERHRRSIQLSTCEALVLHHLAPALELRPVLGVTDTYIVVAGGYVGQILTDIGPVTLRSKFESLNLPLLLGFAPADSGAWLSESHADPEAALLRRFIAACDRHWREEALPSYRDYQTVCDQPRGRLDLAEQMRRPTLFAGFACEFTDIDRVTPLLGWLLGRLERFAGFDPAAHRLRSELVSAGITTRDAVPDEPEAPHGREAWLLGRWLNAGSEGLPADVPATLLPLERLFEHYLLNGLGRIAQRLGRVTQSQVPLELHDGRGPTITLRADLVWARNGQPAAVLDAKWKSFRPQPADLQQIVAYAHLLGVHRAVLVYPGRGHRHVQLTARNAVVDLVAVRVAGPTAACERSLTRLATLLDRPP